MRLIDADALKQVLFGEVEATTPLEATIEYITKLRIDNAPTIDVVPATIEGALGYLHEVGWMQEHDRIMTEDAVPVVQCRDCRYYQDNNGGYPNANCKWCTDETPDADDFCSYGERKDNE